MIPVYWYHRLDPKYSESLKTVLKSGLVTDVIIRTRGHGDPPDDALEQAKPLAEMIRAAGKRALWSRWLWANWGGIPNHAVELAQSPAWINDQILRLNGEARTLGARSVVDVEPYKHSPLRPYRWNVLPKEWVAPVLAAPLARADFVQPASFSPDRDGITFYGLYSTLGQSRIAAFYWKDGVEKALDPRTAYEVYGACLGRQKKPQAWDDVADLIASRVWQYAQGLFLYPLPNDTLRAAQQLVKCGPAVLAVGGSGR